jgi:hypothetical protein
MRRLMAGCERCKALAARLKLVLRAMLRNVRN